MELLGDVVSNPTFPEREIERLRKETLSNLNTIVDSPTAIAEVVTAGLLYGNESPYGHSLHGSKNAIGSLTKSDLLKLDWLTEVYNVETNKSIYDITDLGYQYYFAICMSINYTQLFDIPLPFNLQIWLFFCILILLSNSSQVVIQSKFSCLNQ